MTKTQAICILALALTAALADAQQVYKSIDSEGNVTYSSTPPDTAKIVEQVPLAPPPSEAAQKEADNRLREIEREAARRDKQRATQRVDQQAATTSAEQELDDARIALEDAKIKKDSDWQRINTGGRVLKQSYLDRVQQAEDRVKSAESALRKARR